MRIETDPSLMSCWEVPPNNSMQRTSLRDAADAERSASKPAEGERRRPPAVERARGASRPSGAGSDSGTSSTAVCGARRRQARPHRGRGSSTWVASHARARKCVSARDRLAPDRKLPLLREAAGRRADAGELDRRREQFGQNGAA